MIWVFIVFILTVIVFIIWLEFTPIKKLTLKEKNTLEGKNFPSNLYTYKVITHIHTQFSFDSLGKPEDIKKAMKKNNIDYVFVTDHDNDYFKHFEDDKVFAGIEVNTEGETGRLLKLGGILPVISHPNNKKVKHYRWRDEYEEGYLYELLNFKDVLTENRKKIYFILVKNAILYPIFKRITRKWYTLVPLEKWIEKYFKVASHLKIVCGSDLHIKLSYKESTFAKNIPSYEEGFTWLVNYIITDKRLSSKDDVLNTLSKGHSSISINQNFIDIWLENQGKAIPFGESAKIGSKVYLNFEKDKVVKILKKDKNPILITEKKKFGYTLEKEGKYHIECYEYDFKLGGIYFGFRPIFISNLTKVI